MAVRRGITILSDVVLMVALLMLISALWIYSSQAFKAKRTLEATSAEAAVQVYDAMGQALATPGSCASMSISIPRGVRIYIADLALPQGNATAIIVKEAGRRIETRALASLLAVLGAPRENVKVVYDGGRAVGAAILINGTLVERLPLSAASLSGQALDVTGINWSSTSNTTIMFNYKTTSITICSTWNNTLKAVALRVSG